MNIEELVALRVKMFREAKEFTQTELAHLAKVPQSAISDIESGTRKNPGIYTIRKIAAALGVSTSELLGEVLNSEFSAELCPTGTE